MPKVLFPSLWVCLLLILAPAHASVLRREPPAASAIATPATTAPTERSLADKGSAAPAAKTLSIPTSLGKQQKKLKFLKIIQNILHEAKERKLEIKSIQLGSDLQRVFDNKDLKTELNKYVNDPKFDQKVAALQKKVNRRQRVKKAKARRLALQKKLGHPSRRLNPKFGMVSKGIPGTSKGGAGGANGMNFQFLPGIAGVPFPPMMMNGPHYHPPMNFTVNSIPNPNPRSTLDPFQIEQSNLGKQVSQLTDIKKELAELESTLSTIDEDVDNKLSEKYQRVLEIGT